MAFIIKRWLQALFPVGVFLEKQCQIVLSEFKAKSFGELSRWPPQTMRVADYTDGRQAKIQIIVEKKSSENLTVIVYVQLPGKWLGGVNVDFDGFRMYADGRTEQLTHELNKYY